MPEKKAAKEQLFEMLNQAIAREIQVSIQYMWQHIQAKGFKGKIVGEDMKKISITEMKHAEDIAEHLFALGGTPTTKPNAIEVGSSLKDMLEFDIKAEEEAIKLYKEIINFAKKQDDLATKRLFEKILLEEMEHLQSFENYLLD
ncbi:ferritin-like domain-containing protein [Thermodesulfobium sp. 4217-1]|uniref:ferritin-like domain-containing protein n=1 Tax=Thermodesulfobium sp. 4217-1 TaxID=3120013 RepID=UPI003221EFA5